MWTKSPADQVGWWPPFRSAEPDAPIKVKARRGFGVFLLPLSETRRRGPAVKQSSVHRQHQQQPHPILQQQQRLALTPQVQQQQQILPLQQQRLALTPQVQQQQQILP